MRSVSCKLSKGKAFERSFPIPSTTDVWTSWNLRKNGRCWRLGAASKVNRVKSCYVAGECISKGVSHTFWTVAGWDARPFEGGGTSKRATRWRGGVLNFPH